MPQYRIADGEYDGIIIDRKQDEIICITICDWIDSKFPQYWMEENEEDYMNDDKLNVKLIAWLKSHNFLGYASPRETFSFYDAIQQTKEKGCVGVVMEDLS